MFQAQTKLEVIQQPIRVHLACGNDFLPGWINLDKDVRVPGVIQCDLTEGVPFKNEAVDEILASHFLEHLKLRHEAIPFLQECYRVLKPGGIISFITPNFEILYREKISQGIDAVASATFGDGRTEWDYHISAWWPERFRQLAEEGYIHTSAESYRVWEGVEVVQISTFWRLHSPYEVTAVFRKPGGSVITYPTWLDRREIVGDGFMSPFEWRRKQFINRINSAVVRLVKQVPILARLLRATRDKMLKLSKKTNRDGQ
jgi:SAM-dependent methyltransferase